MDGALAFHYSFTPFLILPSSLAYPRFDLDAYCAELYREVRRRLRVVRAGLLHIVRICDASIDGIALLDIAVQGLHDQMWVLRQVLQVFALLSFLTSEVRPFVASCLNFRAAGST